MISHSFFSILLASALIVSAFWLGTMLRRKVRLREWFLFVLFWAITLSLWVGLTPRRHVPVVLPVHNAHAP